MTAPTEVAALVPNDDRGLRERFDIRPHGTEEWPESLYTFEQMWSRLAGEPRRVAAAARRAGTVVHRFSTARAVSFTARSPRPEQGSGHG